LKYPTCEDCWIRVPKGDVLENSVKQIRIDIRRVGKWHGAW